MCDFFPFKDLGLNYGQISACALAYAVCVTKTLRVFASSWQSGEGLH